MHGTVKRLTRQIRILLIIGLSVVAAGIVHFLPPLAQNPAYHNFADQREIWGVPNLFNVISNAPFVLVGVLGLFFLLRNGPTDTAGPFLDCRERTPFLMLFAGVCLTGFGSAYYHLAPSNATLFWDRLPMTTVFMSLFAAVIAERISIRAGQRLLPPLLAAGIGSVVYSQMRELTGGGDLRFYFLVQFFPLLAIPLMLLLFPPKYTRSGGLFWLVGLYALAKIFELLDAQLFAQGGFVSGHTLKHLLSAMAAYEILRMLKSRRPVEPQLKLESVRNRGEMGLSPWCGSGIFWKFSVKERLNTKSERGSTWQRVGPAEDACRPNRTGRRTARLSIEVVNMARPRVSSSLFFLSAAALLLALPVAVFGKEKDNWQPIPPAELALKNNPANPGAPAMILYREINTDDPKSFETHYYRIKIFTDEGKKYADIEIPYIEKLTRIEDIRARTVRPDGTAVEFQGQVFDKVVVKAKKLKFQAKTFTLPDVQRGSIIEYGYTIHWREKAPDILTHPQNYIVTAPISIPTAHWVIQHELFTRRARFSILPIPKARSQFSGRVPKDATSRTKPDGTFELEVENILAFQEEEYMPPEDTLKSRVDFFYIVGFSGDPGWFWNEYGKQRAEATEKFIGKQKSIQRAVAEAVAPNDPPETKLRKLYARAQQIRYLTYEHLRTKKEEKHENLKENESVEDVLKHGYARANEINLLFAALVRAAGFEASVVEVVERDRALFERSLLNPAQFSAMVVSVRLGSEDRYFDPATRYCPFGFLPWEETGVPGIRLDVNGGVFVETPDPKSADTVTQRKATLQLLEDGSLTGKLQVTFVGQEALRWRTNAREQDESGRRKELQEEVKGWLPAGASVELAQIANWERPEEPLHVEFTVKIQNVATHTGRRMLLPLAMFESNKKLPFQSATRVHPIYFHYPFEEVDDVAVQLPKKYRVETVPAARKTSLGGLEFDVTHENQAGALHMRRHLAINGIIFSPQEYPAVRRFFDGVRTANEEQVVLRATEAGQHD